MIQGYADVCPTTSRGAARRSKNASDLVSPWAACHRLGNTFYLAVRGREVMANSVRAVGKHPLPISPSRDWFALYQLC